MNVQPRLLNPTICKYEMLDESKTVFDPVRREPVNIIRRKENVLIPGQFVWIASESRSKLDIDLVGREEQQIARVTHLVADLDTLSHKLKVNDKLIEVDEMELALYVWRIDFASHYSGRFTLAKIHLSDRKSQDG